MILLHPSSFQTRRSFTNVLIIANGDPPSRELLKRLFAEADLILAADGAANMLAAIGICPHVVLGDFDSLDPAVRQSLEGCEFVHALDQEASDLDKAIAYARERGAERITVTGAGGGRIDHALTNVSILMRHHPDVDLRIVDDSSEIRIVSRTAEFRGAPGDRLSLICFAPIEGVTIKGVRWPLHDETLRPGSRGVSNEFVAEIVTVTVRSGILVATHLKQHDPRSLRAD